jgi:hypothetical protein
MLEIERRNDCILNVNWLTAISDEMCARTGGEAAAKAALGPDVRVFAESRQSTMS